MKTILLAGGKGTRISEESISKPKPLIEIGGMPIIWHIMKEYSFYGFNEFIICAGYKQEMFKDWFSNYYIRHSDVTFDFTNNGVTIHNNRLEPWKVTVVDTGFDTMTGGRIKRVQSFIGNEPFMLTYGDGVCDVEIDKLLAFHREQGKIGTLTSVTQGQQKGILEISGNNTVRAFREKNTLDGAQINAGYMILEPEIFNYIAGDDTVFEH